MVATDVAHTAHVLEWIVATGFAGLSAVTGYFLKKQNEKIESVDTKISSVKDDIAKNKQELEESIKNNKKETIQMFQDICHERQDSCGRLQIEKLNSMHKEGEAMCMKISRIKEDRGYRWKSQEKLNDEIKKHLAKYNGSKNK